MRIEIDKLEELGGRFSQVYESGQLPLSENDIRLVEPVKIRGRIRRDDREVRLLGELEATIEAICGRCLKPVVLPIRSEFAERFVAAVSWRAEEQHELREEDLNLAVFDGETIDLDDLVREEILLAVPGHILCRENCQGLCPTCGVDRNATSCQCEKNEIDLRWQGLKELQM